MKALLVLTAGAALATWAVAVAADTPPASATPPPADGPAFTKVSGPFTSGNLTVFLLHGPDAAPGLNVLTLQEAIEQKKVVVHETSEVNALSVENVGDLPVFIQTGDIVRGGKQDRSIAMDLIVPKGARVGIASFCVEAGRWRQRGSESAAAFGKSDQQVAGKDLKRAINDSRMQGEVWKEVANTQARLAKNVGAPVADPSSPSSLQLTLENKKVQERLAGYEKDLAEALKGKADVIGVAVVINGQVEGAEVYGSAALCAKLWQKLLKSAATDALAQFDDKKKFEPATAKAVEAFLADAAKGESKEVDQVAALAPQQERGRSGQVLVNQSGQGQAGGPVQQQRVGGQQAPPIPNPPAASPPAANQATGQPQAGQPVPPVAAMTPPKVRIWRYDSAKALLIESRDKDQPRAVIHRSYIAK